MQRRFCPILPKIAPPNKLPSIVACGSRDEAFKKFKTAVQNSRADELCALLVDSEGPVTATSPIEHLTNYELWDFAALQGPQVFLMTQVMESWFLADREALAAFYDGGFLPNALRGAATKIEIVRKEDVETGLANATRHTKTKGEYHKQSTDLICWQRSIQSKLRSPLRKQSSSTNSFAGCDKTLTRKPVLRNRR